MTAIITVKKLTRVFDVSKPWLNRVIERLPKSFLTAVSNVEFDVEQKTVYALVGESGSGKSTLLSLICGTIHPTKGRVIVDGTTLADLSRGAADRFRAESIGIIFQQFNLLPFGSVLDNITLPLHFAPRRRKNCGNAAEEAIALCHALSLPQGVESIRAAREVR